MSVGVTEPKSEPVGPALTSKRSSVSLEHVRDLACLLECAGLLAGTLLGALLELGDPAGRCRLGQLPREQEVARVPARDVHDLAAEADLLDVLEQDDLHQFRLSPT